MKSNVWHGVGGLGSGPEWSPLLFELGLEEVVATRSERPGPVAIRRAVRAVVWRGQQLLMVHSQRGGDYKFPGGGVEPGEELADALAREVAEECAMVAVAGEPIGTVIEYYVDPCSAGMVAMASHYFHARVTGPLSVGQQLDDYEAQRGFQPVWIAPGTAAAANRTVLAGRHDRWVPRETRVLEMLATDRSLRRSGLSSATP